MGWSFASMIVDSVEKYVPTLVEFALHLMVKSLELMSVVVVMVKLVEQLFPPAVRFPQL